MALIDKASLLMVPSTYEAGKLYNVLPSGNRAPDSTDQNSGYDQTRADFDFDRGSNAAATRIDSNGVLQKYRENKLLRSNQFGTTWTNTSSTETSGQEGYDGTTNAWKIDITATYGQIIQSVSLSGVNCTSLYVKAGSLGFVRLRLDASPNAIVDFDLSDGSTAYTSGILAASSESVGGGWYRISMVSNVSSSTFRIYPLIASNDLTGSSGNILIQSAQLETGLVATDYLNSTDVTARAGVLVDLPRINYDANGNNGALLLEGSRANLVTQSEYITEKLNGTIDLNNTTSPEGLQNALLFTSDSSAISYFRSNVITVIDPTSVSVFLKHTNNQYVQLLTSGDGGHYVNFDVQNGSIGTSGAKTSNETIESYGNGWYRISATFTGYTGGPTARVYLANSASDGYGNSISAVGKSVYAYGFQVEPSATYPTSYIPTYGTSQTRAADVCGGAGDANTFNSTEGVLYVEIAALVDAAPNRRISINSGDYINSVLINLKNSSNQIGAIIKVSNSVKIDLTHTLTDVTATNKIALKYKANDVALWVNGVEVQSVNSFTAITANTLSAVSFNRGDGGDDFYGNVKQVLTFNTALTDSELATLTTL